MLRYARLGACPILAVNPNSCQLLVGERQDTKSPSIVRTIGTIEFTCTATVLLQLLFL